MNEREREAYEDGYAAGYEAGKRVGYRDGVAAQSESYRTHDGDWRSYVGPYGAGPSQFGGPGGR